MPFTVAVTGANRGIGLAVIKLLANSPPTTPLTILACARKPPSPSPVESSSDVQVKWHPLDLSSSSSISRFAADVKKQYPDGIDVLINNAGVNLDEENDPGFDISKQTLDVNYYGTVKLTTELLPLLHGGSGDKRVVVVSSTGSTNLSREKKKEIASVASFSDIEKMGDAYLDAVKAGKEEAAGWPKGLSYSVSKAMLNGATKLWGEQEKGKVLVNACCPGWCATDTGKLTGGAPKSPEDGARIILKLATGDVGGVTGKYWGNPQVTDRGTGEVRDWTT